MTLEVAAHSVQTYCVSESFQFVYKFMFLTYIQFLKCRRFHNWDVLFCSACKRRIGLTGTALQNKYEGWSQRIAQCKAISFLYLMTVNTFCLFVNCNESSPLIIFKKPYLFCYFVQLLDLLADRSFGVCWIGPIRAVLAPLNISRYFCPALSMIEWGARRTGTVLQGPLLAEKNIVLLWKSIRKKL